MLAGVLLASLLPRARGGRVTDLEAIVVAREILQDVVHRYEAKIRRRSAGPPIPRPQLTRLRAALARLDRMAIAKGLS